MKHTMTTRASLLSAAVFYALSGSGVQASSHAEAPFIKANPKVDATDFYTFRSYESGRSDYVTLIANYQPLQPPFGGPSYFSMDPDALYEIHVDNDGDAVEDISFQFRFSNTLGNAGNGLQLDIDGTLVAVPQENIGGLGTGDNSEVQNFIETYTVRMVAGDRRSGTSSDATDATTGVTIFTKPYDNVGDKTFTDYDAYVKSLSNTAAVYHDVSFAGCPAGMQNGRVFVGQRKESFSIALGEIFDLVNFVPLVGSVTESTTRNLLEDLNITTLALEVHKGCLTGTGNGVIGSWTTASMRQVQILNPTPSFGQAEVVGGAFTQVSRLGSPLVNEVVIGLPDKNRFNASEPVDDSQFANYVTNPTLPAILSILFSPALNAGANISPTNFPRSDLVAAFLTGFTGVNQLATVTASEMLRLNTGIAITASGAQLNLGVAGGDTAGFPNGRRVGDDVTDIALRVVMGALCHPIPVDLNGDGTALDNLGLCAPADAGFGTLAYTDGSPQNAARFDTVFPYLKTPTAGSPGP
jgi:hypothetical protein